jgi:hypothetical protein
MLGMGFTQTTGEAGDWPSEVTHARIWDIGCTWKDIHVAPDTYDWSRLDEVLGKMEAMGYKSITYVACATPRWAASDPNAPHAAPWLGPGTNSLPGDLNSSWKPFIANLSQRYKGRIHAYEIWNEPALADFMYPYDDKNRNKLAQMTKDASRIIKGNDPKALIGCASLLPRPSSGGMKRSGKYLAALKKKDAKTWCGIDFVSCHIYPEGSTNQGKLWKEYHQEVKKTMKDMGCPTTKIWVTETALGLLSDGIPKEKVDKYTKTIKDYVKGGFVFWYAWQRPDLKGAWIGKGTYQWDAIKANWK